jgi:1-acyl-sn-glycerol-3-phosphate acyltransferase
MRALKKWVGRVALKVLRFEPTGARPEPRRYVLIAAPHTSNWDFPVTLALAFYFDVPMRIMGKDSLFKPPFGWFFRAVGGVPVVRSEKRNMVQQMIDLFAEREDLALVVPTEGTRGRVEHWKSGFYHIAKGADVPIVLGFIDFGTRKGGFGPAIRPSGDVHADMNRMRAFYADMKGKRPELFGPIRLRDEGG